MKKVLNGLKWFVLHIEEIIAVTGIAVMLCAVFFNVIMRYCFRNPTAWSDELAMICLAYVTFVGGEENANAILELTALLTGCLRRDVCLSDSS